MEMSCPVCKNTMVEEDFGAAKALVCVDGCKGIWFDWLQLGKLDHQNAGFGEALEAALKFPASSDASRDRLTCPKCGTPMYRHEFDLDKEVNVDECYSCGGIFLDSGELKQIRDHSMSPADEKAYLAKFVEDMPETQQLETSEASDLQRKIGFSMFTRYLQHNYGVKE